LHATLLATSPPSAMWPSSHLDSLSFTLSPCYAFPSPCYIIRTQTCLFSFLALLSATNTLVSISSLLRSRGWIFTPHPVLSFQFSLL
jgi:hypothetical protein